MEQELIVRGRRRRPKRGEAPDAVKPVAEAPLEEVSGVEAKKHEILALGVLTATLLVFLSLLSYEAGDPTIYNTSHASGAPHNWIGLFGANLASLLIFLFGITAYGIPIVGAWMSWRLIRGESLFPYGRMQAVGMILLGVSAMTLAALIAYPDSGVVILGRRFPTGCLIGSNLAVFLESRLEFLGAAILLTGVFLASLMLATPFSLVGMLCWMGASSSAIATGCGKSAASGFRSVFQRREAEQDEKEETSAQDEGETVNPDSSGAPAMKRRQRAQVRKTENDAALQEEEGGESAPEESTPESNAVEKPPEPLPEPTPPRIRMAKKEPAADEPPFAAIPTAQAEPGQYALPSLQILDVYEETAHGADTSALEKNAHILEEKLADFGVQGKVVDICPGPVITMYEYAPAPGIKISRIVSLTDDLAMALRAVSIRVVAPIPGKAAIGIEIPNKERDLVSIRAVLEHKAFAAATAPITIALGKDAMGRPAAANLAKMPHLLIAGATGTGKSVCINTILSSLLFRNTPNELRLLLVDPKRIELSTYEGIPHLIHPVVTDAKLATKALRWAVQEMELRYKLLADKGARNIEGYNKTIARDKQEAEQRGETPAPPAEGALPHHLLPYMVIIIDELADLMMVASREVEESIIRLAQMARAAGIHLILATQRPSVDVLTGIIKANIPTRISFQVSSRIDSRTILDTMGAESLLGSGDMLFLPPGTAKLQRIHGAFISESEVQKLTQFWQAQQLAEDPIRERVNFQDASSNEEIAEEELDEKYDEAVQLVMETRQASISMLQRRLRVGYNRAARMIEMMELQGVVGPSDGVKPREVFGSKEP
ncbi:MAG: DNA translocase FtsK [Syntrophobacteraceae bacterium]